MTTTRLQQLWRALLGAGLLLTACSPPENSGSFREPPAPSADDHSVETSAAPAPGAVYAQLLETLPHYDGRLVRTVLIDYRGAFAQAGLAWPETCDATTATDHRRNMRTAVDASGIPWSIAMQQAQGKPADWVAEFGIGLCEIQGTARTEELLTSLVLVVDTPPELIDQAVANDPIWSPRLSTSTLRDFTVHEWGDDTWQAGISGARPIGEAGQLMVNGSTVVRTNFRRDVDAFAAASRSLADRPHIDDVVRLLTDAGSTAVVLTEFAYTLETYDLSGRTARPPVAFVPWEMMGQGASLSESGEARLTVVMAHATAADAARNVARFAEVIERGGVGSRRWSDRLRVVDARSETNYSIASFEATAETELLPMDVAMIDAQFFEGLFLIESE